MKNKRDKLIKWLQDNFDSRVHLNKKHPGLLRGLYFNYPDILNEAYPSKRLLTIKNKEELIRIARSGQPRPKRKQHLGSLLCNYIRTDREFNNLIKKIAPQWFDGRKADSLRRLLKKMHPRVTLLPNQEWLGIDRKYHFNDSKYGNFYINAHHLMARAWTKGRGGHPKESLEHTGKLTSVRKKNIPSKKIRKWVLCLETKNKYQGMTIAANAVGLKTGGSIRWAIKNKATAGGYHWAYCDENGNIIKK